MRSRSSRPGVARSLGLLSFAAVVLAAAAPVASADEGMWTFDNPPIGTLRDRYGFTPTSEWLDHVRLSAVRFMDGGSGSFVSPRGLVVTNHHVAAGQLQKMSTSEKDYVADGFHAARLEDEIPCPDLEVNILVSMANVTDRVLAAVRPGMSDEEGVWARKAEQARIEKESLDATGLRSDVVTLYQGGEYWLYRYRKHTDVRLVMAPEKQAAFFGGDSDNFTFPRHDLDFAFFRVWEDGAPLATEHYLRWNPAGAADGELVFVAGNPARTSRLLTMRQLEQLRDVSYPLQLRYIDTALEALAAFSEKGTEEARRAQVVVYGLSNARKAYGGMLRALEDASLMAKRRESEEEFRARIAADAESAKSYGGAWNDIERVLDRNADLLRVHAVREFVGHRRGSQLLRMAVTIVQYVEEIAKPDAERLDRYHDSGLEELRFYLFSPAPIHRDLEAALLEHVLGFARSELPADDPMTAVVASLGDAGKAARELAGETRLLDVAYRRELVDGGVEAVAKSEDSLVAFARKVAPLLRDGEKWRKKEIESVVTPAGERIARARFTVYGKTAHPDATFTLRLAFGPVAGYPMNGTRAPYKTTLYGLFDRALGFDAEGEYALPARFWKRVDRLDLATPCNFVAACDTISGNSGSPVINREGEQVGIVFDRNIEGLSNAFLFDPVRNRAVSVHAGYVYEALRKLYDAEGLADELVPPSR